MVFFSGLVLFGVVWFVVWCGLLCVVNVFVIMLLFVVVYCWLFVVVWRGSLLFVCLFVCLFVVVVVVNPKTRQTGGEQGSTAVDGRSNQRRRRRTTDGQTDNSRGRGSGGMEVESDGVQRQRERTAYHICNSKQT